MDRLRAMRVFVAVAAAGSLSSAARKLQLPLTTVSRQLAGLEDELGTSLVARTTRRLTLTEAGRMYLETCRHVLDELAEVESRMGGGQDKVKGDLAITAPLVFGRLHVLPVLMEFLAQYPDVDARLDLADRVVDMTEDGIDVAVRVGPMPDSNLLATKVGDLSLVACAAPAYLNAHGRPRQPADLVGHDCISFGAFAGQRRSSWTFQSKAHGRRSADVHVRLSVGSAEAAIDAAVAGLGVTRVLSYQVARALRSKSLVAILTSFDDTLRPIHVVRREVRRPSVQSRLFAEFAAQKLRARLRE